MKDQLIANEDCTHHRRRLHSMTWHEDLIKDLQGQGTNRVTSEHVEVGMRRASALHQHTCIKALCLQTLPSSQHFILEMLDCTLMWFDPLSSPHDQKFYTQVVRHALI